MKITKYILLTLIGLMWSCDEFLDTPPESQISLTDFWQTKADAELGVAAVYDAVQSALEEEFWLWGEVRGDNYILNDRPSSSTQDIIGNNLSITTGGTEWSELDKAIANANVAIEQIPQIPAFDNQNDLLAQALAIRAMLYFYAVGIRHGSFLSIYTTIFWFLYIILY